MTIFKFAIPLALAAAFAAACTTTDPNTGQVVRNNTATGALAGALGGAALGYMTNTNNSQQNADRHVHRLPVGATSARPVTVGDERRPVHSTAQALRPAMRTR